jgi:hypothetical protein
LYLRHPDGSRAGAIVAANTTVAPSLSPVTGVSQLAVEFEVCSDPNF